MDVNEFVQEAKRTIDEIASFYDSLPNRPVLSNVQPGYLRPLLPSSPPLEPTPFPEITADIHDKILPGITHWASPKFMAFFPCSGSHAANIAEMWSNTLNGAHFNWICSPAVTELETIVMDWLAKALGLPECYLSGGETHGGGIILGTASEAILTAMVAARDRYLAQVTSHLPDGSEQKEDERWHRASKLVALGSSGAHSSTKKAAQIMGVRFVEVPITEEEASFAMTGAAFAQKVKELRDRGLEPFYLTATLGSTDVCAVDDFVGIAQSIDAYTPGQHGQIWVHVDAAYAGSALVIPAYQHLATPFSSFDSFNVNPHKWMLTTFDCSAFWVKSRAHLVKSSLSIKPPYLRNQYSDNELVTDYRDWQIPLGRRFRSLKLWFVMRSFGLTGLRAHIQKGIDLGESLEKKLRGRSDLFTIFTPARFALVTFRVKGKDEDEVNRKTEMLYDGVNNGGEFYLTSTVVNGKFAIRVATGVQRCMEEHVQRIFDVFVQGVEDMK